MKRNYIALLVLAAAGLSISACSTKSEKVAGVNEDGLASFNADSLKHHVMALSHDSMMGRKPFTEGETKTVAYLQKAFKEAGLEPGNGDSYLQEVPMVNITTTAAPTMDVEAADGKKISLKGLEDYVIWTDKTDANISLSKNELVFAGYGIVAPEYNWNDYEGLDVKDKVVLVMVNDPGFASGEEKLFKGKTMTYYGRWTYKFEEAARQGAKGCLIIHTTEAASYPFTVVQNNWNGSRLRLDTRGKTETFSDVVGWVSYPTAQKLFAAAGKDTSLLQQAHKPGFKHQPMGLKLSTSISVTSKYDKTQNVIAKITGSKRPDEVIIYTAHWDHLGIGKPDEKGDSIYNGALDNATGTAGLIELGRAFKSMKTQPERTIVFLAVTAEEQGLWGSAYYAQNPIFPVEKTVANINIDGLNVMDASTDIITIGKGQSELEDYLKEAAESSKRELAFETHPEAGYYYRSDHFNFAKVGIPALYTKKGVKVEGKAADFGEKQEEDYRANHYHRPSDELDPATWTMAGGIEDLKLLFQVGRRLAFETTMPKWKEGSEFKAIREKTNNSQ